MRKFFLSDFPLILIIFCYLFVIFLYSDFVPLWDGWIAMDTWILNAVSRPFNLFNFDSYGHPSMIYFLILGLSQYLDFGNVFWVHITNALLNIGAIIAFYEVIKLIFTNKNNKLELNFLTFLFAFYPVILANTFQVMPDYGVYLFFILFLYFFLKKKIILSLLAGISLVFSKESGFLLFCLVLMVDFGIVLLSRKFALKILKHEIQSKLIYVIPIILFILRFVVKTFFYKQSVIWEHIGSTGVSFYDKTFSPQVLARIPYSYILSIFVLNFNWILTIFAFLGILILMFALVRKKASVFSETDTKNIIFIIFVFFGAFFLLTIFKTFTNPRYFLPIYPLLLILFYFGLITVIKQILFRRFLLIFIVVIFFFSNFFTFDPLSKKLFGTFKFGKHEILNMTSTSGECCGYGRDQLVYNLQYTQLHYILNEILMNIKPNNKTAIVYHPLEGTYILPRIDRTSFKRSVKLENTIDLYLTGGYGYMSNTYYPREIVFTFDAISDKPNELFYIEFPNMDNSDALNMFGKYYITESRRIYGNWGYEIPVRIMALKK